MPWTAAIKRRQLRRLRQLPRRVQDLFVLLEADLRANGPEQPSWPSYSRLSGGAYHCHLNHRYVACGTADKHTITIEVYDVGSREDAPY